MPWLQRHEALQRSATEDSGVRARKLKCDGSCDLTAYRSHLHEVSSADGRRLAAVVGAVVLSVSDSGGAARRIGVYYGLDRAIEIRTSPSAIILLERWWGKLPRRTNEVSGRSRVRTNFNVINAMNDAETRRVSAARREVQGESRGRGMGRFGDRPLQHAFLTTHR